MASICATAASRSSMKARRGASWSARSICPRMRSRPTSRSPIRRSRAICTWTAFPREGVPFELEVPRAALTQDYSSLEVGEFARATGRLRGRRQHRRHTGRTAGTHRQDRQQPLRPARAADQRRASRRRRPRIRRRSGQVELDASWRLDGSAMQIDPLVLDARRHALHGQFPARRRRGSGGRIHPARRSPGHRALHSAHRSRERALRVAHRRAARR